MKTIQANSSSRKHSHHQYIATSGGAPGATMRTKYTTRHLAALDFLLNVPMSNETKIREAGMAALARKQLFESGKDAYDLPSTGVVEDPINNNVAFDETNDAAGKRLQGTNAPTIKIPANIRYHIQRHSEQSALMRHWEDQLITAKSVDGLDRSIMQSRLFFSRSRGYPVAIGCVIKYDAEKAKRQRLDDQKGLDAFELEQRDWRGCSYKQHFIPSKEERASDYYYSIGYMYDPNSLDDPNLLYGSHRYVLQKSAVTGPIMSSIILYVNKDDLKQTLNEQFRDRHPQLPQTLTLSKIRNLKKTIILMALRLNIELSTVALAFINFERLCLKSIVTKENRKLSMAVSLMLSYKFLEPVDANYYKRLSDMLDFFDTEFEISRKQLFDAEFGAYVHLNFALHVPRQHIDLVFHQILQAIHKGSKTYLSEDMLDMYQNDVRVGSF